MRGSGSGEISFDEFNRALPLLGISVGQQQAREVFDQFDKDSSGEISFREFNKLLRKDPTGTPKKKKVKPTEVIEIISLPALKREIAREVGKLAS